MIHRPLAKIKDLIRKELKEAIQTLYPSTKPSILIEKPPREELGDLSSPVSFSLAKDIGSENVRKKADEIAKNLIKELEIKRSPLISNSEATRGHINFFLDWETFSDNVLTAIQKSREEFGKNNLGKNESIVIEHTSANPVAPLHIGNARNAVIGDALANLFRASNYDVQTRYYLDDLGKQVAYLAYGYSKVRDRLEIKGKPDHFFGVLYSCTIVVIKSMKLRELKATKKDYVSLLRSILPEVKKLRSISLEEREEISGVFTLLERSLKKLQQFPTTDWRDDARRLQKRTKKALTFLKDQEESKTKKRLISLLEKLRGRKRKNRGLKQILNRTNKIEKWMSIASNLKVKWPEIYKEIDECIVDEDKAEEEVEKIVRNYENGKSKVKDTIRRICKRTFEGFEKTLDEMGISFNRIDWESDIVWKGLLDKIINELKERNWTLVKENNALELDIRRALKEKPVVRKFFGSEEEIRRLVREGKEEELPPNLVLMRGDGSSLYGTRDIAYSLKKFRQKPTPMRVLNVIGKEQSLVQKQVAAGLYLAGFEEYAKHLEHISYELIHLPHVSMSAREGRYRTLDEIIEGAKNRAYEEIEERGEVPSKKREKVARKIGIGAIRYFLLSVDPMKAQTFKWEEVMNFKRNSGPFVQYSYARATSILAKANCEKTVSSIKYESLNDEREKSLLWKFAQFPEKVQKATQDRKPNIITEFCNELAKRFHNFYEHCPVIQASNEELKRARLSLVKAFVQVLKNALELIGIAPLERM